MPKFISLCDSQQGKHHNVETETVPCVHNLYVMQGILYTIALAHMQFN